MILEQNSSMPLYEQLKNAIKENIQSGKYPAGFKIPNEEELCIQYSVSRITVRRSVKDLCDEGYLVKKQGKGEDYAEKLFGVRRGKAVLTDEEMLANDIVAEEAK